MVALLITLSAVTFGVVLACGILFIRDERHRHNEDVVRYENEIGFLRIEKDKLLATALEANRVQYMDPQRPAPHIEPRIPAARRIESGLSRLAAEDAQQYEQRQREIAAEIDEARRKAEGIRPS